MIATAVGVRAAVLRMLLLAVLAIGVLSMHTVGHVTGHDRWAPLPAAGPGSGHLGTETDSTPPPRYLASGCDHGACAAAMLPPAAVDPGLGSDRGHPGVVVVCLAVLVGLGLLALLAAGLARRRRVHSTRRRPRARLRGAGPHLIPGFRLRIVDVAVLRT